MYVKLIEFGDNSDHVSFGLVLLFFFRLSTQGQVLGTNLSMLFDTAPSLLGSGIIISVHHPV